MCGGRFDAYLARHQNGNRPPNAATRMVPVRLQHGPARGAIKIHRGRNKRDETLHAIVKAAQDRPRPHPYRSARTLYGLA